MVDKTVNRIIHYYRKDIDHMMDNDLKESRNNKIPTISLLARKYYPAVSEEQLEYIRNEVLERSREIVNLKLGIKRSETLERQFNGAY